MKLIKKILMYVMIMCLTVTLIPPMEAAADTYDDMIEAGLAAELEANDGIEGRLAGNVPDEFYGGPSARAAGVVHDDKFAEWTKRKGIDVSHHQGVIDWKKVAADGIDFVFVRVAGRGYGAGGNLFEDALYKKNLKEARAAGLDVGVYIYSQAITQKEAKAEAAYILERIKGYDVNLPVVFDYEYYPGGRLSRDKLTDDQRTAICRAFCEAVKFKGYEPMIYANKSMLKDDLDAAALAKDYQIWLAHYTNDTDYNGTYTYWQYTSDGSVDGIKGRVDRNYQYIQPKFRITDTKHNSVSMEWEPVEDADGYIVYRRTGNGTAKEIGRINDPEVVKYTDTSVAMNTVYSYFVRYYITDENGEAIIYKSGYPAKKTVTPLKIKKVTAKATAVSAGSIKVSWNKEPNATGYVVQRYNSDAKKYETVKTITSGNTLSLTNINRKLGTTYKYRVRAFADVGGATVYGYYSDPVSAKTLSTLKTPVLTAKPYSYTTNKLSWTKIPGAAGYKVQRYNSSQKKWVTVTTIKNGNTTAYTHTYLNCNTSYKYRVRATATLSGKAVYSKYSETVTAKTKASRVGVVKEGPLNVRKGAGTKYGKYTQLKAGTKVTVIGSTKSWYKIKIKIKGVYKIAYVNKQYVKLT